MAKVDDGPGALAERVKGKAKQAAGTVLGDENLKEEGRLHESKADAEQAARKKEEVAEHSETVAEVKEKRQQLEAQRRTITADEVRERAEETLESETAEAQSVLDAERAARLVAIDHQLTESKRRATDEERIAERRHADALREVEQLEAEVARLEGLAELCSASPVLAGGDGPDFRTLPRRVTRDALRALRAPVDVVAKLTGRSNSTEPWGPLEQFDAWESAALGLIGRVTGDDVLVNDAASRQEAASLRSDARTRRSEARRARRSADDKLDEARRSSRESEQSAEREARRSRDELTASYNRDVAELEANKSAEQAAIDKADEERREDEARRARNAEKVSLSAEDAALAQRDAALAAEARAEAIDAALEDKKKRRKS